MVVDIELGTRERLLEAAGEVFAERGFLGATVRAICLQAQTNVASVNYHFGDKEALYKEALTYAFQSAHSRNPDRYEGQTVSERVASFVGALLRRLFTVSKTWHGQLIARELADPRGALDGAADHFMRPTMERLDQILAEACPALTVRERHLHAFSLVGQCVFFRHARPVLDQLYGPDAYGEEQIPVLTDHIVAVFLRGLKLEAGA